MSRTKLGEWTCPSGNHVVVYLAPGEGHLRNATCEWDSPPPLSPDDEHYYLAVVLPALTKRAQEVLERPGRALVVFP